MRRQFSKTGEASSAWLRGPIGGRGALTLYSIQDESFSNLFMSAVPIKVQCSCGQRYSFEAEPVNGKLSAPVACPVCGVSGTLLAEQTLAQTPSESGLSVEPKPRYRIASHVAQPRHVPVPVSRPVSDDPRRRDFVEAKLDIERATSCAFLIAGIDLIFGILSLFGISLFGIHAWIFADVLFLCALGYGLFRRSRTCAITMLIYYLVGSALMFRQIGLIGVLLRAVFIYFFGTGISGSFKYHRLKPNLEPQF